MSNDRTRGNGPQNNDAAGTTAQKSADNLRKIADLTDGKLSPEMIKKAERYEAAAAEYKRAGNSKSARECEILAEKLRVKAGEKSSARGKRYNSNPALRLLSNTFGNKRLWTKTIAVIIIAGFAFVAYKIVYHIAVSMPEMRRLQVIYDTSAAYSQANISHSKAVSEIAPYTDGGEEQIDAYLDCYAAMLRGELFTEFVEEAVIRTFVNGLYSSRGVNAMERAMESLRLYIEYQIASGGDEAEFNAIYENIENYMIAKDAIANAKKLAPVN